MTKEATVENKNVFVEVPHKVVLVGVGAATMLQENVSGMTSRLVEEGEQFEKTNRKRLNKIVNRSREDIDERLDDAKGKVKSGRKDVEKEFTGQFDKVLSWLNIPTRSDVKALNRKVTTLTKKVDELNKASLN